MGCTNADGTLTESAKQMLRTLEQPMTAEQAATAVGQPLFRVRANLRQMTESKWATQVGDNYQVTELGRAKANETTAI